MEKFNNPEFLDKKYQDLAGSEEVERSVKKARRKGESLYTREERINTFMSWINKLYKNRRGFEFLKQKILDEEVTKPEEIPESYWRLQENIMREQGQLGDWNNASEEQKSEIKKQNSEGVLDDQRASLEEWLEYFHLEDSDYIPPMIKYWIFRNIIKLQEFDKNKHEFPKRSKGTVKMFPDLNQEALGYVIEQILKKYEGKPIEWEHDIQPEEKQAFEKYLNKEDFAKLYSWAHELMNPIPEHLLPVTEGEWRKFDQGSDSNELVKTIRGKGTGWCTAGQTTAKTQLTNGDFYVYYSLDDEQKTTIPRLAIRMENGKIAEVRGIAYKQNVDPHMTGVLEAKLQEFPDKDQYLKKKEDMEKLTIIDNKTQKNEKLSKTELEFLYEINSPIEGFGYQKDPRIGEIRSKRNKIEDACVIFECTREQIATKKEELTPNTKAYIGPLYPNIVTDLPNTIEKIYTTFPEGEVYRKEIQIPPEYKTPEQHEQELESLGIQRSVWGHDVIKGADLKQGLGKKIKIIIPTVASLGFPNGATRQQIQERAKELGFGKELLPAITGIELQKQYKDQPLNEYILIDMDTVPDRDGNPYVFFLYFDDGGLKLHGHYTEPSLRWNGDYRWVFRFRK